jgi:hypothetical protein
MRDYNNELLKLSVLFQLCRDALVEKLDKMIAGGFTSEDVTLIVVAGTIYHHMANYETALRILHQGDHLEWYGIYMVK